jgi:hypothetical protein
VCWPDPAREGATRDSDGLDGCVSPVREIKIFNAMTKYNAVATSAQLNVPDPRFQQALKIVLDDLRRRKKELWANLLDIGNAKYKAIADLDDILRNEEAAGLSALKSGQYLTQYSEVELIALPDFLRWLQEDRQKRQSVELQQDDQVAHSAS